MSQSAIRPTGTTKEGADKVDLVMHDVAQAAHRRGMPADAQRAQAGEGIFGLRIAIATVPVDS
jgi:hypothetical protein